MALPKIAALYDGEKPEINKFPENLKQFFEIFIKENWLDFNDQNLMQKLKKYDALVMRPKWGGKLEDNGFNLGDFNGKWNQRFQIATFSISKSKIQLSKAVEDGKVNIITAEYGNLDSTAELAIWMAIALQRKLHLHCMGLAHKHWKNDNIKSSDSLKGKKWAIIGIGKLGSRVLARLPGLGISQVKTYYDNEAKKIETFKKFIKNAFPNWKEPSEMTYETKVDGNPGYDSKGNPIADRLQVNIEVSTNLDYVIRDVDVICLTLPYEPTGKRRTKGFIRKEHFENLKKNAIFINIARAEILDKDVYETLFTEEVINGEIHLKSDKNYGFGSDVLAEDFEKDPYQEDRVFQTHRVWAAFSSSMLNAASSIATLYPKVLLTPHIGGATPDAEIAVADEVIEKLLENFGILEKYEVFYKKGKKLPDTTITTDSENVQAIKLDDDEKVLCNKLLEQGYNLEEDWPRFLSWFAKNILPVYKKKGVSIFLQNKKNRVKLPCNWEFKYYKNEKNTAVPHSLYVCELYGVGKNYKVEFKYSENAGIFSILSAYRLNGHLVAFSDWVKFTLLIFHTITSRCEDREGAKGEWILRKGNILLDEEEEVNWKTFVGIPTKERSLMEKKRRSKAR